MRRSIDTALLCLRCLKKKTSLVTIERTLADGFARFQRDVPRQRHSASGGEESQLDRDTNRAGFTVAIIPINRARPSALGDLSYELARSSRHLRIGSRGAVFEPRASAGPSRKFPLADPRFRAGLFIVACRHHRPLKAFREVYADGWSLHAPGSAVEDPSSSI